MTVVYPEGVQAEGNVKVVFVTAIADPEEPTIAELNAGVDLSCFIKGTFELSGEQATGSDRRLCSKEDFQVLGRITRSLEPITYVYDPQAAASEPDNEAYETLKAGVTGFLAIRYGLDAQDTAWAASQKVDVAPVECGFQKKDGIPEDDEFAKLTVTQTFGIIGPVADDAVVSAT